MTLSEMLHSHDWYYEMSDDHRYWTNGGHEEAEIFDEMAKHVDKSFEERKALVAHPDRDWHKCLTGDCKNFYRYVFRRLFSEEELELL